MQFTAYSSEDTLDIVSEMTCVQIVKLILTIKVQLLKLFACCPSEKKIKSR
jgi:hypothetical protein